MNIVAIFFLVLAIFFVIPQIAHVDMQQNNVTRITLEHATSIVSALQGFFIPLEEKELLPNDEGLNNLSSLQDIQIFPKDHIWNVPIDTLPVDARSATYINTIDSSSHLRAFFGEGGWPYNVVDNTQATHKVIFLHPEVSDQVPYPIPDNPLMEGGGSPETCTDSGEDCHVLIVNKDTKYLYELFSVKKFSNGTWTAFSGAVYNLSGYSLRPKGWGAADAAGLAMLPGLVKYDEVEEGEIDHAIRFALVNTNASYVWPAIADSSAHDNGMYPPMGQRFRLKASFDTSGYPYQARIILEALKKYGMILADNGIADIAISGTPDTRWNQGDLDSLQEVKASDFEAVDVRSLIINENSGQARIIPFVIPTPAPTDE
jgi:hypothetical protein